MIRALIRGLRRRRQLRRAAEFDRWGDPWVLRVSGRWVQVAGGRADEQFERQRANSFLHNRCPHCGTRDELYRGPRGGMSQNILCGVCGSKFNWTGAPLFTCDLLRGPADPIPEAVGGRPAGSRAAAVPDMSWWADV